MTTTTLSPIDIRDAVFTGMFLGPEASEDFMRIADDAGGAKNAMDALEPMLNEAFIDRLMAGVAPEHSPETLPGSARLTEENLALLNAIYGAFRKETIAYDALLVFAVSGNTLAGLAIRALEHLYG